MEGTKQRLLTGNKAMAEAIRLEMEADGNVFVLGEDVLERRERIQEIIKALYEEQV